MGLYSLARKVNARRKEYIKKHLSAKMSPVRRIEFVYPPAERAVAMTFDDGPCAAMPVGGTHERGLTDTLLDTLAEYGAHASFDVIGTTAENYPDTEGSAGSFTWSGVSYDHYPRFGEDVLAGAFNRPELIRRILAEGHEITNHGGTHRLFGPMRAVYGTRRHFQTLAEVTDDLRRLDSYMLENFACRMTLARPAHYIDKIPDGSDSYDAYRVMGYNYMAASFDGGGWIPCETYEEEVAAMVAPLKAALERDPNALNGRIIFQKDGCNMALRTPIADALPLQLELLKQYGYRVVSVSELLEMSPFEDMDPASREAEFAKYLLSRGHTVACKNNSFYGDRPVTADEFILMLAPPEVLRFSAHADFTSLAAAAKKAENMPKLRGGILGDALWSLAVELDIDVPAEFFRGKRKVLRRHAVELAAKIVEKQ